jgi:DNA polymerase III alpha subunit
VAIAPLPEFDAAERIAGECRATGLWFSGHPLDRFGDAATRGVVPAAEIERHVGRRVAVAGLTCASRRVETRDGGRMLFLTVADRSGLAECVLFPPTYRACARAAERPALRIEGRIEEELGAVTLTVERVAPLE